MQNFAIRTFPHRYNKLQPFITLVNIPVEGIRLLDAVCLLLGKSCRARQKTPCAFCSGVVSAWCHLLRKSDVWRVDLFKKEPRKGNSKVHVHTPTKFGEDLSKDLRGVGEQTNKQTDRQTNAARFIVWCNQIVLCIDLLSCIFYIIEYNKRR